MVKIDIRGVSGVQSALKQYPGKAHRACAVALNQTGKGIKTAEVAEMQRVFDRPTRYTLNSIYLKPAKKDNLVARVWFKEPERMGQHYLVPQVDGGPRKLKGIERALGNVQLVPGSGAKLDAYGNISGGTIRQIMSVLKIAENWSGHSANITARSRAKNKKPRDYVYIQSRHGKLLPGVYQRYQTGVGFGAKTKATFADRSRVYQRGNRKVAVRDPETGRILRWETPKTTFQSIIRGRGLKPIMVHGQAGRAITPLLNFYRVANKTFRREFAPRFWDTLNKFMGS